MGFPFCHHTSREWSECLLFQACSTSVSGQIHLTEVCTIQLQPDPSIETQQNTSGSRLRFGAKGLTRSGTLLRAPPCSLHCAVGMTSPQTKRLFLVPGKTLSCAHETHLSCLLQRKGAAHIGISYLWAPAWIMWALTHAGLRHED